MIIDFSVENFGSIKSKQTLSFEASNSTDLEDYYVFTPYEKTQRKEKIRLLKLGIIYGPNASGKSTILKAIDFLHGFVLRPAQEKMSVLDFDPFLFNQVTPTQASEISIRFIHDGIRFDYKVNFNRSSILLESLHFSAPNRALVFDRVTDTDKQLAEIKFGDKVKISKSDQAVLSGNTLWNNTVLAGFNKTNIESELLTITIDWFNKVLRPLIKPKTDLTVDISTHIRDGLIHKESVVNFMKEADFHVDDFIIKKVNHPEPLMELISTMRRSVVNNQENQDTIKNLDNLANMNELKFRHKINNQYYDLAIGKESDGSQRYFQLAGLLTMLMEKPCIQAIDEFESSLHPDLIKHFLLMYLQNVESSQLLLTTHYRELLQDQEFFRKDVIWFTEKQEDAATVLYSLADFPTDTIRKTSSVYNAYKIGKLGAVPNL